MSSLTRDELIQLARSGAETRVRALQAELETIYKTFPNLRRGVGRAPASTPSAVAKKRSAAWSPAKRKAVSERMRKYWEGRRAASAKGDGKPSNHAAKPAK